MCSHFFGGAKWLCSIVRLNFGIDYFDMDLLHIHKYILACRHFHESYFETFVAGTGTCVLLLHSEDVLAFVAMAPIHVSL